MVMGGDVAGGGDGSGVADGSRSVDAAVRGGLMWQ